MSKKTYYCVDCENEFTVHGKELVMYCPYCGTELDDDDGYEEEEI